MKNICIIGGGACGVAAFIELFIQISTHGLKDKFQITIIEKAKKVGYGLAFGTTEKSHLLNTQADLMGIYAEEVEHFSDWLSKNAYRARGRVEEENGNLDQAYTSRILYGDYLHEQFTSHLEKAEAVGLEVKLVCDQADDVGVLEDKTFSVHLQSGDRVAADFLILALGNPEATNFKTYEQYPEFVNSPWPAHKMIEKIDKHDHVGIIGTSLSAIDVAVALMDHGHEGKISMFSIEGMLPRVQPIENNEVERKYLTLQKVHQIKRDHFRNPKTKELFRLFMRDVENAEGAPVNWKAQNRCGKKAYDFLVEDIASAEKGGDTILNTAYSLRHEAGTLWSWLDEKEKSHFKNWLGPHWTVNRHGMPLCNAKRLAKLFEEGVLEVHAHAGEIKHIDTGFEYSYGNDGKKKVDKLVNATGSPSHVEAMDCTLTANLLNRGLIQAYPSGGVVVNEMTLQALNPQHVPGIYATGHLVNGMLLDINAVWFNVKSIASMCKDLVFKAQYGTSS